MIYLDYNGSTPLDPLVAEVVDSASALFANPSSMQHSPGQGAAEAIEEARHRVGSFVGRGPRDVIFTSGASEGAAIGIIGAVLSDPNRPNVVVAATEHKAILEAAHMGARLARGEVRMAKVGRSGVVDLDHLEHLVDSSVALVAVMGANNETGVIAPVSIATSIARREGSLFFADLTQLAGKSKVVEAAEYADLVVFSSHKIYGPKGAGALIASRHVQRSLVPIFAGGGQEHGLRGGTQNTAGTAGFGVAAELAEKEQTHDETRLRALTNQFLAKVQTRLCDVDVNGAGADRLSNTLNLRFRGADADAVMASMPTVAVSSGSACQSAVPTQSHVLRAMGLSDAAAAESIRISLGRPTTAAEVSEAADKLVESVTRVREMTK